MGRRGPIPKPTALKRAAGVRRDRLNQAEPVPRPFPHPPPPPEHLCPEAKEVWTRLAHDLHRAGVLTPWDVDLFAAYCDTVVVFRRAAALVQPGLLVRGRQPELLVEGRRDPLVTNPAWRAYRDALGLLRVLAQEFGLTPSSRSMLAARQRVAPPVYGIEEPRGA